MGRQGFSKRRYGDPFKVTLKIHSDIKFDGRTHWMVVADSNEMNPKVRTVILRGKAAELAGFKGAKTVVTRVTEFHPPQRSKTGGLHIRVLDLTLDELVHS